MPPSGRLFLLSALLLSALLTLRSAAAAPTLSGRWQASGIGSKWVEGTWGPSCGAKPSSGGGSGSVLISQTGSELTISGGGRTYSTRECWTTEPGMSVVSHGGGVRSWKTTCKTGPGAARKVTTTTSLTATDDTITFYETGQYQFSVGSEHCTASVGRYRTYTLVERAETPTAGKATTDESAGAVTRDKGAARCAEPGPVSRVDITPGHRLMSPGDEHSFKALAYDDKGCRVPKRPRWSVEGASGTVEVSADGKVRVHADAPEGEVDLKASFGSRSAAARVEVASKARLDALLARGVDEGPAPAASVEPAVASQSLGAEAAVAEDRASGRKLMFVGLVGVVALGLGAAGLVMARRSRGRSRSTGQSASPPASSPSSGAPSSGAPAPSASPLASAPSGGAPAPGSGQAGQVAPSANAPVSAGAASSRRIPSGTAIFGAGAPPASWSSGAPSSGGAAPPAPAPGGSGAEPMKKLCPVCGRQYPAASQFCGQDGASLVPLS